MAELLELLRSHRWVGTRARALMRGNVRLRWIFSATLLDIFVTGFPGGVENLELWERYAIRRDLDPDEKWIYFPRRHSSAAPSAGLPSERVGGAGPPVDRWAQSAWAQRGCDDGAASWGPRWAGRKGAGALHKTGRSHVPPGLLGSGPPGLLGSAGPH